MLDNLYTWCRDTCVKSLSVTLPANENFPNAASVSLVQDFIYLISLPPGDTNGAQFFLVKLAYPHVI